MPLVFDPRSLPEAVLRELHRSLREDLESTNDLVLHPAGDVRDPASLETAAELLRSTLATLDLPGERSPKALASEVNLAYATMIAVIDLVKSHTEVPRVPHARKKD